MIAGEVLEIFVQIHIHFKANLRHFKITYINIVNYTSFIKLKLRNFFFFC